MTNDAKTEQIESFWEWFVEYEDTIKEFFDEETLIDKKALIEEINNQVLDFGMFSWEIGPGSSRNYYLTISPNGKPDQLELSRRIMAAAPDLPDWEFHHAKPAKDWNLQFTIYDDFMHERLIDASSWQFALMPHSGGQVDIFLQTDNIDFLDAETRATAGDLVVTNLLGEERKINYVRRIEVLSAHEEPQQAANQPIQLLRQQLEAMVNG